MLRRNALGGDNVVRRVDIEERIERHVRPVGQCDAMPRGPDLDLADVIPGQRPPQIAAERDRPQTDHRMTPFAGACASERPACGGARLVEQDQRMVRNQAEAQRRR